MINIGLVLLQKDRRYEASDGVILPEISRSEVIFPPIGYPQRNPVTMAKEPDSDT